jgi:hypothetical protein
MMLPLLLLTAATFPGDQWLVGAWGAGPAACASDSGIRFEADGTYNDPEGEGLWELAGDRLMVSGTSGDDFGRSETIRLNVRSPAEMDMEWADGTRVKYHRCVGSMM